MSSDCEWKHHGFRSPVYTSKLHKNFCHTLAWATVFTHIVINFISILYAYFKIFFKIVLTEKSSSTLY